MRSPAAVLALLLAGIAAAPACAEEGMWTFNAFPFDKVEKAYGFRPDQAWLDHLAAVVAAACARLLGELRLAARPGADEPSLREHLRRGIVDRDARLIWRADFTPAQLKDEIRCPDMEANQLVDISRRDRRVIKRSTAGKDGAAFAEARKTESAAIEKECSASDAEYPL